MKKNLYFIVVTLFFISFISCGDDNDDDEYSIYSGKDAKIVVDNQNIPIYYVDAAFYGTFFEFHLLADKDDLLKRFYCVWDISDLSKIKIGDDITQYDDFYFEYTISATNFYEYTPPNKSDKKGSMVITKIDLDKQEISLKVKDLFMYKSQFWGGEPDDCVVNGETINLKYNIK